MKYLIVITPRGTTCFILNGCGGRRSDQHVTEKSAFVKYLIYGDTVMEDCGFNIAETVCTYEARLEIPSFEKGKEQLRAKEVEDTGMIGNVWIHTERAIGSLRKNILC